MDHSVNFDVALQPLVITPSPRKGESVQGFVLRTSELNGYDNPMKLLHYCGMSENEARSARPPLAKLGKLFGKTGAELQAEGLDAADMHHSGRSLPLMGHAVPSIFTRSKYAGICIACANTDSYIEAFHELKYALVCPHHRCKTLHACPACRKPLNWLRSGLTRCGCGHDFAHHSTENIADPAVVALMGVLHAKLMGRPLDESEIQAFGFPLEALKQVSIQSLLSVIYRFGLFHDKYHETTSDDVEWIAVQTMANVFSEWPHRFHDYLENVHAPRVDLRLSGLRGQFNSFYESFFKNIAAADEIAFMREAFISFGHGRWKRAAIDPKLKSSQPSNVVGINGLAKAINVQPSTARKLVAKGLIEVASRSHTDHPRALFDLSGQQCFEFAQGKSLSVKRAAEVLDIPVEVLRAYRTRGLYQARYLAVPIALYHERDLEVLRQDLMQDCADAPVFINKQHLTMAQIMRFKESAEIKAEFIHAVRHREVSPVGKLGDKPSHLLFDRIPIKRYFDKLRLSFKGSVSFEEAGANRLDIGRDALLSMVSADILRCKYDCTEMRVCDISLTEFENNYISLNTLARMKSSTKSSLMVLCNTLGIKLYQVESNRPKQQPMLWVERRDMVLLGINIWKEYYLKAA